jgi:carbon-monoxide dehydrogenase large subunit
MFGARVKRIEDPALLRGRGRFVDDIEFPGLLHAAFVRSPHAHARIGAIDTAAARSAPGVHAVFTLADLRPHISTERLPVAQPSAAIRQTLDPWVLAADEACHVGEPVAVVIADSRYLAEDAAALVAVDYRPLPAAVDARAAALADAPPAHDGAPDNVVAAITVAYGDVDAGFAGAAHTVKLALKQHKGCGHAIECRGVVARWDAAERRLTVWAGTQMPHRAHGILVALLRLDEDRIRVIAPDVGGGFGPKFVFYPEDAVVPVAAMMLGRPVKWIEDRREHFLATTQERDQYWDVEAAADSHGRLLAIRGALTHDHGAYTPYGVNLPYNAATNLIGPYVLPAYEMQIALIATNKVPVTPVRGAGRPQGTFVMERIMDALARKLGLDRAEVRRRNLIPADQMPYTVPIKTRDGAAMTYDSGDYPACQAKALDAAGYVRFAAEQARAAAGGRRIGIGLANYVEGTGRGPYESALVRIGPAGRVTVFTGASVQGQGLQTALAQIAAGELGVAPHEVQVIAGDTATIPLGLGAFASRQAVTAGNSTHVAARAVRDKALKVAGHLLEAAPEDLELSGGRVRVKGADLSVGLADIAKAVAGMPGFSLPGGIEPGLEATSNWLPPTLVYCNGTHVATVEVDVETGAVKLLSYVVVHDSGRLINPMIVEGQVIGGTVHGIGNALFEWMGYDESGQPVTTNFAEYLLPTAPDMPRFELHHMESPSPLNPLGVKGAGEGGTIPAAAAIVSAIEDALTPYGVTIDETPVTPARLVALIAGG